MIATGGARQSNSSYALEKLRAFLDRGVFGPDGQLPTERDLAERMGIGRRAIRRALDVLETEGLVWRRQGAGTFAGRPPRDVAPTLRSLNGETNMLEVMEVRLRLEPILCQLAAMRATGADVDRLDKLATRIASSRDGDGRELWDGAFHRAIAQIVGNALFLALFDIVDRIRQDDAWRHIRESVRTQTNQAIYAAQHREIVNAITDRDPMRAELAMRRHLLTLQENLLMLNSGAVSDAS